MCLKASFTAAHEATRRESLVGDRVEQCEDCPLVHIFVAKTEDCFDFSHHRFGSTASALNWKVRSQPKLKACCSRGLRVWSRFDKSKKLG